MSGPCHLSTALCLARYIFFPRFSHVTTELKWQYHFSSSPTWFSVSSSLLCISFNIFISQSFQYVQSVLFSNNYLPLQRAVFLRHAKIFQGWCWFCRASVSDKRYALFLTSARGYKKDGCPRSKRCEGCTHQELNISAVRVRMVYLPWHYYRWMEGELGMREHHMLYFIFFAIKKTYTAAYLYHGRELERSAFFQSKL